MKVLISDFDGTLYIDDEGISKNVPKIKEFREKGNVFIISTARNYEAIKKACVQYNINVDYFFCDIGSVVLDNNGNVLYKQYINSEERDNIEDILKNYENIITIKRYGTNGKQSKDIPNVVEYKIEGERKIIEKIKSVIDNKLTYSKTQITEDNKFIIHTSTKEDIIEKFIVQNKFEYSDIITVGDELDDLEMLRRYNGFRMEKCNSKVRESISKSVNSVSELIDQIIMN